MIDQFKAAFFEEAAELLENLETSLLDLENDLNNRELLESVFRVMHTLKGSAGMVELNAVEAFAHELETAFDKVRDGKLQMTDQLTSLTLRAKDQIQNMISESGDYDQQEVQEIIRLVKNMVGEKTEKSDVSEERTDVKESQEKAVKKLFAIHFKPAETLLINGSNPFFLLEELQELGECTIIMNASRVPDLESIAPENCYLEWQIIICTAKTHNDLEDVFIFVVDDCELNVRELADDAGYDLEEIQKDLKDLTTDDTFLGDAELQSVFDRHKKQQPEPPQPTEPQKIIQKTENSAPKTVENKPAPAQNINATPEKSAVRKDAKEATIRVPSGRLDELVNLVGELVTLNARLTQHTLSQDDQELTGISESLDRLTSQLRNSALNMRMIPVGTLFSRFSRLARDLGRELNKDIELFTSGEETEMDKTVIERLNDPMVHLIRNCADHGIESTEDRIAKGKPANGTISLTAQYSGAHVMIQIKDDGKGLDIEAIRAKAIDRGLIDPDTRVSDTELFQYVFHSGFSTAKQITKVSGRGVGLDVVRRTIEELRGTITLFSEPGIGTTFTLKLPLTLAIIDGLLVSIGDGYYVLPLSSVHECLEFSRAQVGTDQDQNLVNLRGKLVPYINLRNMFGITTEEPEIQQVVIAEINNQYIGFVVDNVIGQHQTVIKSLGKISQDLEGLSGATIMGNGSIALILDIFGIYKQALQKGELA